MFLALHALMLLLIGEKPEQKLQNMLKWRS